MPASSVAISTSTSSSRVAAGRNGCRGFDDQALAKAYNDAWADAIKAEGGLEEVWCAEQLEGCTEEDRKKWGKRAARHVLRAGDVVWADSDQPESITRIDASQIGRRAGHPAEAAVPAEFRACTDPNDLCWSCRMFGMVAGERQADDRSASFAGHVRFGWAELNTVAPKLVHLQLPALSSPKPANGWYLLPREEDGKNQRWDAKDDLLEIAGSKLYLHKKSVTQRQGEHPDQCADVNALPSGVKFTALLRFENLSDAELGSLVAALDPRQLARDDDRFKGAALKVGMGKPVGLGSIRCSLEVDEVDRKKRYQGLSDDHVTRLQKAEIDRLVDAFLTGLRDGDTVVDGHWPALAAALDFDLASGVQVTYPPGPRKTPHEHFNWFGDHRQDALAQPEQLAAGRRQGR